MTPLVVMMSGLVTFAPSTITLPDAAVIVDAAGFDNYDPVPFEVEIIPDLAPQIALLKPGGDRDIPEAMRITAASLNEFGLVDAVLEEPLGGALRCHGVESLRVRGGVLPRAPRPTRSRAPGRRHHHPL